ncbi:RNA polymerase sigma-70 factor (sigma-E family) [Catenuloplanes nepalensis]|uniref:RNA polymerase sigma-70 factor (Sigma-E family) n=1 Tax=Catenuloplanes nepalensis TaxID=587533 RepID=A0ABT9MML1_9ACTN|nr:SigE family RNA polymerase sigma factor [Catenuloplanes nepalensis]MDP9792647.1 RNA polymerase sigma-70 factor (sigma-E family) [Catenuloplanes nepalensis]
MSDGTDADYLAYVHGRMATLRRWAYLLSGDTHQADDLVQETLTTVYSRWHRVSRADNIDGYVHRILVRTFLNERRRGWWKVRLFGDATPEQQSGSVNVEERQVLRAALTRITPSQQAVLVLRFLCDQSVADTAQALGVSEGTVKSQTKHALTAMRRILGERMPNLTLEVSR